MNEIEQSGLDLGLFLIRVAHDGQQPQNMGELAQHAIDRISSPWLLVVDLLALMMLVLVPTMARRIPKDPA